MAHGYSCLTITAPTRWVELLTSILGELGTLGCQIHDGTPTAIVAYFEGGDNLNAVEHIIRSRLSDRGIEQESVTISHGAMASTDWEAQWRETLSPARIGRRWLVRPSWHSSDPFDRDTLIIDPKMAFGTGTHATTHLCLVELEELVDPGMSVLDVGTGSGILAIAAAKMGARPTIGVEIDPVAIECAKENITLNDVENVVELVTGTLDAIALKLFDLVVANIEYRTLVEISPMIRNRLQPGGFTLFSGILHLESDRFLDHVRASGMQPRRVRHRYDPMTDDRWVSVVASAT